MILINGAYFANLDYLAGSFLLYHVIRLTKSSSTVLARSVVHASVLYLPVVLGLMIAYRA